MKEKITIEIIKGEGAGQKFEYEDAERIFVGRQADCGIVLPEKTV
jgi:serine/threonine-protein kinase